MGTQAQSKKGSTLHSDAGPSLLVAALGGSNASSWLEKRRSRQAGLRV